MKNMKYLSALLSVFLLTACGEAGIGSVTRETAAVSTNAGEVKIDFSAEELKEDYDEAAAVNIRLSEISAETEGDGAVYEDGMITITKSGTYVLSGVLKEGAVTVNSEEEGIVRIVLKGAELTGTSGPAIYVANAGEVILTALSGTKNILSASGENTDGKKGGIYTKDDLVINGGGSIEINTEAGDGIHGNDSVKLLNAMVTINSAGDGIEAHDLLGVQDCILSVTSKKDGMKAGDMDEETGETTEANVLLSGGVITVTSEDDGIQATGNVEEGSADVTVIAGGGHENAGSHSNGHDGFNNNKFNGNQQFGNRPDMGGGRDEESGDGQFPGFNDDFRPTEGTMPGFDGNSIPGFGEMPTFDEDDIPEEFEDLWNEFEDMFGGQMPSFNRDDLPEEFEEFSEEYEDLFEEFGSYFGTEGSSGENDSSETEDRVNAQESDEAESEAAKGVKADGSIILHSGSWKIDSADDAFNANGDITVKSGTYVIDAGDDGMHADAALTIEDGKITVNNSYEGLEAKNLTINGGTIELTASDDGINTVDKNSASGGMFSDDGSVFTVNGGSLTLTSGGDGLDMNGSGVMNGGTVTVYGPTAEMDGAIDAAGDFVVNGGVLLAGGSSGMAVVPSESSKAYVIHIGVSDSSGPVEVKDSSGNVIAVYESGKQFTDLVIASDQLKKDETYTIYENGKSTGEITISSTISSLNTSSNGMSGGMGGGMRPEMGGGQGNFNPEGGSGRPDSENPGFQRPDSSGSDSQQPDFQRPDSNGNGSERPDMISGATEAADTTGPEKI